METVSTLEIVETVEIGKMVWRQRDQTVGTVGKVSTGGVDADASASEAPPVPGLASTPTQSPLAKAPQAVHQRYSRIGLLSSLWKCC